jgi:hypothetical protein
VVGHQAVGDDAPLLLGHDAREPAEKVEAVEIVAKDRLAVVPARGDVVIRAGFEDPQLAAHVQQS